VGPIDILIANAALPSSGTLDSFTRQQIDRALDVNLRAPITITHALLPAMLARGRGHLVYISSIAGKVAALRSSLYSATKFGLRGFAGSLRADLKGTGVGVSTVFPGFIREAGMFHDSGAKLPPGVGSRRPHDVALAVASAITRDRGEVDVASLDQRAGGLLAALSPELAITVQNRFGRDLAEELSSGQSDKR
jgi:short-subunit dehydrogenase